MYLLRWLLGCGWVGKSDMRGGEDNVLVSLAIL